MRNKVLRTIFPDRATTVLNSGFDLHSDAVKTDSASEAAAINAAPADLITHLFSQLVNNASNSALASSAIGNTSSLLAPKSTNGANVIGDSNQTSDLFSEVSKNLDRLRSITETQVAEIGANTSAISTNTAAKSASQTLSSVGNTASSFLGGLTALPLISGLFKLFGGSSTAQPPTLQKYNAPSTPIFDEALVSGNGGANSQTAGYDRFGNPRLGSTANAPVPDYASLIALTQTSLAYPPSQASVPPNLAADSPNHQALAVAGPNATQVTVNIQAMDSRSFLDRSQDIAQAVREAMLNMHSINDVVNDL